jgi:hypothetical protein
MAGFASRREISRLLAARVDQLVVELLPAGRREGNEWRIGSVAGEPGHSLGVHLARRKAGIWADFSTGQKGDALDLVQHVLRLDIPGAIRWSRLWLDIGSDNELILDPAASKLVLAEPSDPHRWRKVWQRSRPIAGTIAEAYLGNRKLRFDDPNGDVLRFNSRRARKSPADQLEHHPALVALLRDIRTGEPCGLINIYLQPDGSDRIRDKKGKTVTGRAGGAAVMLEDFADVTLGLVVAEGVETAISLWMAELRPVWALGSAGNLKQFPVLVGIEALTVAADADNAGRIAAAEVISRWRRAGREALAIPPPYGDWADQALKRRAVY